MGSRPALVQYSGNFGPALSESNLMQVHNQTTKCVGFIRLG
jgi:hypothetical protein